MLMVLNTSKIIVSLCFCIMLLVVAISCLTAAPGVLGVGVDLQDKARLLRDLPLGYDGTRNIPPRKEDRTLIDMGLAVRSVDLNFESGLLRTDGWMSLRWTDPRFVWDPQRYGGLTSLTLPFSDVWAPEVILHNSLEEKFAYRQVKKRKKNRPLFWMLTFNFCVQVGLVKHTGEFVYVLSIHAKSSCEPNFDNFPFGLQLCQLKFGSWINEHYRVEYRLGRNETVSLDDFTSPTGWRIVASDAHLESKRHPLFEEPSNTVVYNLAFKRDAYFDPQTKTVRKVSKVYQSVTKRKTITSSSNNK